MIEFKNISKIYEGDQVAAKNINLKIHDGEFVCFIGTSGSGKTTCMRMINRMNKPTEGQILIDGKDIRDIEAYKLRRKIGYVIQRIGLMPHMTIYENIVMVPKLLKWDEKELRPLAEKLIKRVDLPVEYLEKYPHELSGGQQQRIGVIRALAADQKIILMDEPFGALDPITRDSLQKLVKKLQRESGKTFVLVTHDMDEAISLADKIVIMDKGEIVQQDTPENILKNPANDFVRELLGDEKLNEAKTSYDTVETIMYKHPISIHKNANVKDALPLMKEKRVDTIFVIDDENHLLGIMDIFDISKWRKKNPPIVDVMHKVYAVPKDTKIIEAIQQFYNFHLKNLPIIDDDNRLVGLMTRASIVDNIYMNMFHDESIEENDISIIKNKDLRIIVQNPGVANG